MKNENPGILKLVISFALRILDIFEKCTEKENLQIFKFTIFFSSKGWNLPKTLKIIFFVLYDITYNIQNTRNGNNYLNLPINSNNMRYFFWRVYLSVLFADSKVILIREIIETSLD